MLLLLSLASILGTAVLCYAALLVWIRRQYARTPGPPVTSFFFGHLPDIINAQKKGQITSQMFHEWHLQYGYTIKIFIFHEAVVVTCDPSITKDILLEHPRTFPKGATYKTLGFIFGERTMGYGLLTERDYMKWLPQRSILNPAFHRRYLIGLISEFNGTSDTLIKKLHEFSGTDQVVEISKYFYNTTLDIIAKVAFGLVVDTINQEDNPLSSSVRALLKGPSVASHAILPNWSPLLYKERRDYKRNLKVVKDICNKLIKERFQEVGKDDFSTDDILSVMVKAHAEDPTFDLDLITDNLITFFVAGQDTTGSTLSFALMELGRHPNIMEKLKEEIDSCVGKKTSISYEDVSSLKYCSSVIKETLRLYPVAPGTVRTIPVATTYNGLSYPAGAEFVCLGYSSSRHPDFMKKPLEFIPDRFYCNNQERVSQLSYYPFSLGARSCIGQNFAMMEMKIVLVKLLQHFNITLDKSQSFTVGETATLHPAHGVHVVLTDRS